MSKMQSQNPRWDELNEFVTSKGWQIVDRRAIQDGEQDVIFDGLNRIPVNCFWTGKVTPQGKPCETQQALKDWADKLPPPKPPKAALPARKFVRNANMGDEERLACEFKEVKGTDPARAVESEVDEYVVAYLNADATGSIYFGVRDDDHVIVGVRLDTTQRDELKRRAISKIGVIEPAITPDDYEIQLHPLYENESIAEPIPDWFVIQCTVRRVRNREIAYYTGSKHLYVKTESGRQKYQGVGLTKYIINAYLKRKK